MVLKITMGIIYYIKVKVWKEKKWKVLTKKIEVYQRLEEKVNKFL